MINTELNDLMILQFDLFIGLRHFRILCVCCINQFASQLVSCEIV